MSEPRTDRGLGEAELAVRNLPRLRTQGRELRWLRVALAYRLSVIGVVLLVLVALFCFVGPLFYRTDQVHTNLAIALQAPSHAHLLGTDSVGYDVLGRLMTAGQSTLIIGVAAALLSGLLGAVWGGVSGYWGGWVDSVMMRIVDVVGALPSLLVAIFVAAFVTPNIIILVMVITFTQWVNTARLVRGETLSIRTRDYVLAAKAVGSSGMRNVVQHILRNTASTTIVQVTFEIANAIMTLATLSFLGLGIPPPAANWGGMLSDGLNYIFLGYWWLIYPAGVCLMAVLVAFNFIGEALRDALEVRLQDG